MDALSWTEYKMALNDNSKNLFVKMLAQRKRTFTVTNMLSPGMFTTMWQIANKSAGVWLNIERIFSGQVENPKSFKKPKSVSAFNQMGGVDEGLLEQWLLLVIARQLDVRNFTYNCRLSKQESRVRQHILDLIHATVLELKDEDDFAVLEKTLPSVCNDKFIASWAFNFQELKLLKKHPIPTRLTEDVLKFIDDDKMRKEADDAVVPLFFFSCFFSSTIFRTAHLRHTTFILHKTHTSYCLIFTSSQTSTCDYIGHSS
jgi:hypothetical protein